MQGFFVSYNSITDVQINLKKMCPSTNVSIDWSSKIVISIGNHTILWSVTESEKCLLQCLSRELLNYRLLELAVYLFLIFEAYLMTCRSYFQSNLLVRVINVASLIKIFIQIFQRNFLMEIRWYLLELMLILDFMLSLNFDSLLLL